MCVRVNTKYNLFKLIMVPNVPSTIKDSTIHYEKIKRSNKTDIKNRK